MSFEFFPPKTAEMEAGLCGRSIARLAPLEPDFVSVTYGAGGSTRERTHATVARIVRETELRPAAHLTCVGATRAEVDAVVRDYWAAGVRHIVALRGDPPGGVGTRLCGASGRLCRIRPTSCAASASGGDFEVSVSAYPEKHPESPTFEADLDVLRPRWMPARRAPSRSSSSTTPIYLRYVERVRARGIGMPIVPGIVPVQNFRQTASFAARTGASVPEWLADAVRRARRRSRDAPLVSAAVAAEQVLDLVDHGVRDFHFYTMNRAELVYAICRLSGLRPEDERDAA